MLVWSVHGHGAVVTRNSWKEGTGGNSSQEQRTRETLGGEVGLKRDPASWVSVLAESEHPCLRLWCSTPPHWSGPPHQVPQQQAALLMVEKSALPPATAYPNWGIWAQALHSWDGLAVAAVGVTWGRRVASPGSTQEYLPHQKEVLQNLTAGRLRPSLVPHAELSQRSKWKQEEPLAYQKPEQLGLARQAQDCLQGEAHPVLWIHGKGQESGWAVLQCSHHALHTAQVPLKSFWPYLLGSLGGKKRNWGGNHFPFKSPNHRLGVPVLAEAAKPRGQLQRRASG